MKGQDIIIGQVYRVKVSGSLAPVRIDGVSQYGGWEATNMQTRRRIRIRGAGRIRYRLVFDNARGWVTTEAKRSIGQ